MGRVHMIFVASARSLNWVLTNLEWVWHHLRHHAKRIGLYRINDQMARSHNRKSGTGPSL